MSREALRINSKNCPVGDFIFAAVVGQGVFNEDKEAHEFKVTLENNDNDPILDELDDFVEENQVKGKTLAKKPYQTHEDYDGIPEGKAWLQAKTNTEFDGKPVNVNIYDSNGNKTKLPDGVSIGKGSTSIIIGSVKMWDRKKEYGASFYLSGVQIGNFVPYEFEDAPEAMEGGSFNGFNDMQQDEESAEEETPTRSRRKRRER